MSNQEIEKHEVLKQASVYSYDVNKNKIPNGYTLIGVSSHDSDGTHVCGYERQCYLHRK